jgi:hypothetical protein
LSDAQCFTVSVTAALRIDSITLAGSTVTLQWPAAQGRTYRVQYKTNLTDAAWLNLPGDVSGGAGTATKSDTVDNETRQRFYRLELLP